MRIEGKIVLITGASEGIGAACVEEFRARGARSALVARQRGKLEALAAPQDLVLAGDLTDAAFRRDAVAQTEARFGRIDVLLNVAGIGLYAPSALASTNDVRAMFELNLFVPLELAQLAVPGMRARREGAIVNVSSIAGLMTLPWLTLYSASKFALCSLTEGLRMELRDTGIHAMAVCPGYVNTGFQDHVLGGRPPESMRKAKRFAITAGECARAIADGLERGRRTVVTPGAGRWLVSLARLFPSIVEPRLARMSRQMEHSS